MTAYYIFRHGDTIDSSNIYARIFGHKFADSTSIDILPQAIPSLNKIGAFLKKIKTDANFTSPYPRCVNSANIVGKISNKTFNADTRLAEFEKKGEQFLELQNRVVSFINYVESKKYSSIAVCTHGAVIGALKHLLTRNTFSFFNVWDYPQPGNLIIIKGKQIEVINFN